MSSSYLVSQKLVICGSFVEHYKYSKPYRVGQSKPKRYKPLTSFSRFSDSEKLKRKKQNEIREDNIARTRQKIRRLTNSNNDLIKFLTITFSKNFVNLCEANLQFSLFIKKLKYLYPDLKYVAVPEFQKRGAVHYHLLCNIPFIDVNKITKFWGKGFCYLRKIDNIQNMGSYISKYLSKANGDLRFFSKKKFFYSRNLVVPVVVDKLKNVLFYLSQLPKMFVIKESSGEKLTDFLGVVKWCQYLFDGWVDIKGTLKL